MPSGISALGRLRADMATYHQIRLGCGQIDESTSSQRACDRSPVAVGLVRCTEQPRIRNVVLTIATQPGPSEGPNTQVHPPLTVSTCPASSRSWPFTVPAAGMVSLVTTRLTSPS